MRKAGAVVIGVDKTGGLDPLKSAAAGALDVADWLRANGLDVVCLVDGPDKVVTAQDVSKAIAKFATKPPTYDFLVVYFSGHGLWQARTDHWLLSGAPVNTTEAINLEGAMFTARACGIPNISFISDACRTLPRDSAQSLVSGVDAFPNYGMSSVSKIDYFKATGDSRPAYEIAIAGKSQSVLTHAILSIFASPEPQIISVIKEETETLSVIPNRKLETVLQSHVDALLDGIEGSPVQDLDMSVPSADTVYISRVNQKSIGELAPRTLPSLRSGPDEEPQDRGLHAFRRTERPSLKTLVAKEIEKELYSDESAEGRSYLRRYLTSRASARDDSLMPTGKRLETGFVIVGPGVSRATAGTVVTGSVIVPDPLNAPTLITLIDAERVGPSVVVELEDGRCVVLAAVQRYVGVAHFNDEGLFNVSYAPTRNNVNWSAYLARKDELDGLHHLASLAVKHSVLRVRSEEEATKLADRIRIQKAIDPTLGLYAAYAFAQAGRDDQVRKVGTFMREDLGLDLFDVRMLSGSAFHMSARDKMRAPFCPMLTQGWNLLRAYRTELPSVLNDASKFLSNSLWTTFNRGAAKILFDAASSGEVR